MRKFICAVLVPACFALPAHAATAEITYLTCAVGENPWQVALNESAGTVAYVHKNGVVFEKAAFTADRVVWESLAGRTTISRTNLSLLFTMDGEVVGEYTCTKVEAPKRAF